MEPLEQLQQQVAQLTQQLQGLAAERNQYRQELQTLQQQMQAGTAAQPAARATGASGSPFAGVLEDPTTADAWLKQQVQGVIGAQGFITQDQVNELVQQSARHAYESWRNDGLIWRNYDQLVNREVIGKDGKPTYPYRDLAKYDSEFSKLVAKKLQDNDLGGPLSATARDFATEWGYKDIRALQWAADLVRMDQDQAQQASAQASQAGQAAQAAAGLSAAQSGGAPAGGGTSQVETLMQQGADPEAVYAAFTEAAGASSAAAR